MTNMERVARIGIREELRRQGKPLLKKKRISWQNGLYYEIINNPELAKLKYKCLCFGCNTSKNKYSKCNINHIET